MDPQNHRAAQAPHTANTDTSLNRWLSSPGTTENDDNTLPAIDASNRHAEKIRRTTSSMLIRWTRIAHGSGALPQPVAKYNKLQKQ
ncbi:uncharacterized [Tachysurus ichikawai]